MAGIMACYHHTSKQAVGQCSNCGKGICKNCYDTYRGVCYDCAEKAADESLDEAMEFKSSVVMARKGMITGSIVGGVIGLVIGIAAGVGTAADAGVLGAIGVIILAPIWGLCLGGSLVAVVKAVYVFIASFFKNKSDDDKGAGCLVAFIVIGTAIAPIMIVMTFICPIVTGIRFFKQKKQMAEADTMIEDCEDTLAKLRDYHKLSMAG